MGRKKSKFKELSKQNQQLIIDFVEENKINGQADTTLHNKKTLLTIFAYDVKKHLRKVTKKDVKTFFKNCNLSVKSQETVKVILRKFYRWLYDLNKKDDLPHCVSWFEFRTRQQIEKESQSKNVKDKIVSEENYQDMLNACTNIEERAIVETLYLSGARVSEICAMNISHVKETEELVEIYLPESKTQSRWVPLTEYPENLIQWTREHQFASQPNKPLWVNLTHDERYFLKRMGTHTIRYKLRVIAKTAGIKKNITPHMFRHTRITLDRSAGLPDTHCCTKYGWAKGSDMIRQYDHNSYEELRQWMLKNSDTEKPPTYERLQKNNKILKRKQKTEIDSLKRQMQQMEEKMSRMDKALNSPFCQLLINGNNTERTYTETIETLDGEIIETEIEVPAPNLSIDELVEQYEIFSKNINQIKNQYKASGDKDHLRKYGEVVDKLL